MSEKLKFTDQRKDPKAELQAAIDTLNEFNQQSEASVETPFVDLMRLAAEKFSESGQNFRKKQQDLLWKAVQTLKRNYALITKLEEGNPQDQTLASFARTVINSFNANIDKVEKVQGLSARERIAGFLTEKHDLLKKIGKIDLPLTSVHVDFSDKEKSGTLKKIKQTILSPYTAASSQKVSRLPQIHSPAAPIPKQEVPHLSWQAVQLFYMKVIALIEKHGILSHLEARNAIRKASLQIALDPEQVQCKVTSVLSPFPGQMITVMGAFEKDPKSLQYNIPSRQHPFHLTITSMQTGGPHPSQFTGMAFPDFLPAYPHRLEEMQQFRSLYLRKQQAAHDLHPNGSLLEKAKLQRQWRMQAFNENREVLISLHQDLSVAIAAAVSRTIPKAVKDIIHGFYARLRQIHHPYDYLADTYYLINDLFYKRCYDTLQNAWIDRMIPENHEMGPSGTRNACQHILEKEFTKVLEELKHQRKHAASELDKGTIDFIACKGQILKPWHEIILQQFSETVHFPPKPLTGFAEKMQFEGYTQVDAFLSELELEVSNVPEHNVEMMLFKMKEALKTDIATFKASSLDELGHRPALAIVRELKEYYEKPFR